MFEINIKHTQGAFKLNLDICFESGAVGVFGDSGAGKTTFLNCLSGMVRPDFGRIVFGDDLLFDSKKEKCLPPEERGIATLFQDARLFPHLNVRKNLLYGKKRKRGRAERIGFDEVVSFLEIDTLLNRSVGDLSGGEAQRVAIGRALLSEPRLLLLDEPMSGLDGRRKSQVFELLECLRDRFDVPILLVSHDLDDVLRICDDIIVLNAGELKGQGKVSDLVETPIVLSELMQSGLKNHLTVIPETVDDTASCQKVLLHGSSAETLDIYLPNWSLNGGVPIKITVAPQDVILARNPVDGLSVRNQLSATIKACVVEGGNVIVQIDLEGNHFLAEITRDAAEILNLSPGQKIFCLIKSNAFRLLDNEISSMISG